MLSVIELTGADIAQIILAFTGLVTALAALRQVTTTKAEVKDVHTAVNSNLTASQDRNAQLTATLTENSIVVPQVPTLKSETMTATAIDDLITIAPTVPPVVPEGK